MAREIKSYIIDIEIPEDLSPEAISFTSELTKIISDGCAANGLTYERVKPSSRMPASYAEAIFEVNKT